MTKIGVMLVLTVLLVGSAIYLVGTKVNPAVVTKSGTISTSISTAAVDLTSGTVTSNAP